MLVAASFVVYVLPDTPHFLKVSLKVCNSIRDEFHHVGGKINKSMNDLRA